MHSRYFDQGDKTGQQLSTQQPGKQGLGMLITGLDLTGDGCAVHCTLREAGGPITRGL